MKGCILSFEDLYESTHDMYGLSGGAVFPKTILGLSDTRVHMGGCQNHGPFVGTLNNRCRSIIGTQKGTIILTTTHMYLKAAL